MLRIFFIALVSLPLLALEIPKKMDVDTGFTKPNAKHIELIIAEMMKRNGIKLNYRTQPNLRSLKSANSGISDAEAARILTINKLFPNLVPVPESIYQLEIVAVSKNKNLNIKKLEDLKPLRVGVIKGMKIAEMQVSTIKPKQYITANSSKLLMGMLEKGRLDVAVINFLGTFSALEKMKLDGIYLYKTPLIQTKLYFQLHKKNKHLVPLFLNTIKEMKADGTLNKINKEFESSLKKRTAKLVTIIE